MHDVHSKKRVPTDKKVCNYYLYRARRHQIGQAALPLMLLGRDMDFASDSYGEGSGGSLVVYEGGHSSQDAGENDRDSLAVSSST